MVDKKPDPQAEEPRSEPEIIAPDDGHIRRRIRIDTDTGRIYVAKVGPLGTILVVLIVGFLSALMLVLLLGALLAASGRAVRYRRARRWSIARLFSASALRPMPRNSNHIR
jgi:hypothetical protein